MRRRGPKQCPFPAGRSSSGRTRRGIFNIISVPRSHSRLSPSSIPSSPPSLSLTLDSSGKGGKKTEPSAKRETLSPAPSQAIGRRAQEARPRGQPWPRSGCSWRSSGAAPPRVREGRLAALASGRALLDSSRSPKQKPSAPERAGTWLGSAPARAAGLGDPSLPPRPLSSPARTARPPPPRPHPGRARPQPGAHTARTLPLHTLTHSRALPCSRGRAPPRAPCQPAGRPRRPRAPMD